MSKQLFESQWKATKAALCEGRDLETNQDGSRNETKKRVMEICLENARRDLMSRSKLFETSTTGAVSSGNVATLNKVILPIIRRVMPTVIANEIIGVQPMTGPVAQIHTLRVRYADTVGSPNAVTAGTEAMAPWDIYRFYSGNENSTYPGAAPTSVLEGRRGNKLSIQILKDTVEARTRRLSATWTIEAAQDAQAQQGIDIESELMAVVAQEITAEIDQEILSSLMRLPGAPTMIYDQANVSGTATYVGDEHAALAIMINKAANDIAQRTRRGAANWAVVSNAALTILQSAGTSAFARTTEGTFEAPTNTKYVGTLNNSMRVYVNAYAAESDPILIGYKGPSEADAAAFYCPYVPLTTTGVIIHPDTLEMIIGFLTRYGYLELSNSSSSLGNAADYVSLIGINNSNLKWM